MKKEEKINIKRSCKSKKSRGLGLFVASATMTRHDPSESVLFPGPKEGNLAREVRGFALLPKLDSFVQKAALKNEN